MSSRKVAVVTGTTSGIGAELAVLLAGRGYDLAVVNRSRERSGATVERARAASSEATVHLYEADLSLPSQVRAAARAIRSELPRVHVLINNAGVLFKQDQRSASGHEMHFQVNVLAPYLLTHELRPSLAAGAREVGRSVVVNVSSNAVFMTGAFDPARLNNPRRTGIFGAYAQSKLAITALTQALAPDFVRDGVELFAVDPGGARTAMTAGRAAPFFVRWMNFLLPGPEKGASNLLTPLDDAYAGRPGLFLSGGKVRRIPKGAADPSRAEALLALCRDGVDAPTGDAAPRAIL